MAALAIAQPAAGAEPGLLPGAVPIRSAHAFFPEVRLGLLAHDPDSPESGSADLNAEILFAKPLVLADPFWNSFVPRPNLGVTLSLSGKTSFVYAGVTWAFDLTKSVFVEVGLGGAVNNGATARYQPEERSAFGCKVSFRETASLGYRFDANWSLLASIEHMSNAGLCDQNRGMTNFGLRLGYRF